jgi:hypothetical protein
MAVGRTVWRSSSERNWSFTAVPYGQRWIDRGLCGSGLSQVSAPGFELGILTGFPTP